MGRVALSLRYRVRVVGLKEAKSSPGPYLVLPNHPAYSDPPNVLIQLWPAFHFRPMLLETNFQNPLMAPFAWLLRGIRVPDLDRASAEAKHRAKEAVAAAVTALKAGENVILWPSGHLMRDGSEWMGGARAVSDILAAVPNVTVVLVRTRGLWGSLFSWAQALRPADQPWRMPKLMSMIFQSFGILLSNLLLFTPRRSLSITLEAFPTSKRPEPTREAVNPWLETWFNADLDGKAEPPTWVPYHFLFGARTHEFPPPPATATIDHTAVTPAIRKAIADLLSDKLKRPIRDEENNAETTYQDLGLDSLDGMDVTLQIEQRFGFTGDAVPQTIGQLWALAEGLASKGPPKPPPAVWFTPPSDTAGVAVLGETVPAAFVTRAFQHLKDVAAADDMAGVVTYEKLLVGARAMAARFREFPEPNVGLLMPASVAGDITLLALHLAGKLPVILNWTTGPTNLEHAVTLMGVKRVVTSKVFVDRTHIEVPTAEFVYLEDVRKSMGRLELLCYLLGPRWFPKRSQRNALALTITDPHKPAVVLFTSGSEKAPKAVPLTHTNVISNIKGCIQVLNLTRGDSVLGFLPLFHSFGHTITGLFPLLSGMKVVHHPDPTDAAGLLRKAAAYRPTLMASTPTFYGFILERAKPEDVESLQLVVMGAEKCPESVFKKSLEKAPKAIVIEGYGITECSPVVSATTPTHMKQGTVGLPLPGVEVSFRDLETNALVAAGSTGMMYVTGPNVFPGYIGHDGPSPFAEIDGKRWYITGDLGTIDADGYIQFIGRLKRFLKAGGEMISLPALEEPFARRYPPTDQGPRAAVEGIELPTGRKVVLFITEEISLKDANAVLFEEGFRGVLRLDEVRHIDKIPILGTGKTDYKVLRAQLT